MATTPWDFVNNCVNGSDSLEGYTTFLTNRTISSNFKMLQLMKFINSYEWSSVPENIRATITKNLLKRAGRFPYRYVKNFKTEKLSNNEEVMIVSFRLRCSLTEALEYLQNGFVDKSILDRWKSEGSYR